MFVQKKYNQLEIWDARKNDLDFMTLKLPTPTHSEGMRAGFKINTLKKSAGQRKSSKNAIIKGNLSEHLAYYYDVRGTANFYENMMGFPTNFTKID